MRPYLIACTGPHKGLDRIQIARAIAAVAAFLEERKREHPDLRLLVGGAHMIDEVCRCEAVRLRLPYTVCVPHPDYGLYYWADDPIHWEHILRSAPKVVYVVPETRAWDPKHNLTRNEYMAKWADELCAVFPGDIPTDLAGRGGTQHCIRVCLAAGKPVYHIDPRTRSLEQVLKEGFA